MLRRRYREQMFRPRGERASATLSRVRGISRALKKKQKNEPHSFAGFGGCICRSVVFLDRACSSRYYPGPRLSFAYYALCHYSRFKAEIVAGREKGFCCDAPARPEFISPLPFALATVGGENKAQWDEVSRTRRPATERTGCQLHRRTSKLWEKQMQPILWVPF